MELNNIIEESIQIVLFNWNKMNKNNSDISTNKLGYDAYLTNIKTFKETIDILNSLKEKPKRKKTQ